MKNCFLKIFNFSKLLIHIYLRNIYINIYLQGFKIKLIKYNMIYNKKIIEE